MKLLVINPFLTTRTTSLNSYNSQTIGLLLELKKLGIEPHILTSDFYKGNDYESRINFHYTKCYTKLSQIFMKDLSQKIIEIAPDAIVSLEDFTLHSAIAARTANKLGIDFYIWAGMYNYSRSHPMLHQLAIRMFGKKTTNISKKIICKTTSCEKFMQENYNNVTTTVIPVGVPLSYGHVKKERNPEGFAFIGRDVPEKNLQIFLDASARIDSKFFVLSKTNKILIDNQINFKLNQKDMPDFYNRLIANVIPANYEIWNITMIEAMACGTPCITTNVGGMRDVINKQNGIKFALNDVRSLREKLQYCLDNPSEVLKLGRQARKDFEQKYNWQVIAKDYYNAFV